MNGKVGLLIGLMIGLVIAAGSTVASMVVTGSAVKDREAKAYEAGLADGANQAGLGKQQVGSVLNQGLVKENADLTSRAQEARLKLQELISLPELGAEAKAQAQQALDALGAE